MWQHMFSMPVMLTVWTRELTPPHTKHYRHTKMHGEIVKKKIYIYSSSSYMALQLLYRVLAFSTNSFHLLLSWARVFQFGTFIFCISFLTSSPQYVFGLPVGLLDMGFQE